MQSTDTDLLQGNLNVIKDCDNIINLVDEAQQQKNEVFIKFSNCDVPIQMDKDLENIILEALDRHYKTRKTIYIVRMKEGINQIQKKEKYWK